MQAATALQDLQDMLKDMRQDMDDDADKLTRATGILARCGVGSHIAAVMSDPRRLTREVLRMLQLQISGRLLSCSAVSK